MQSIDQVQWPGWNVVRLIGRGSFGAVYEIQRDVFGETERAALKVITIPENGADIDDLRVEGYDDESITSRFHGYLEDIVKEYSMMAKMKGHPNVVYCDDVKYVQHDDGIGWDIYIKMELLTPIMKCLDQVENEQSVIDLGIAMCNALVLCKERSIVHRDIKPQNIFVSQDGTFKLGDFGIAKTAERTTSGTKVGTYKYMAPEVYNNRPYGPAADQYSLGLVMYWLLNERRTPFSPKKATATEEDFARKRRFDGEQIPPPSHGSKQLQAIVLKACAYDPKDRFANAAEMRSALEALKNVDASPAAAVPMGAAAAVAGGAAAGVATDELTTGTVGTVGRRKMYAEEEATIGVFGTGAAFVSRQQGQATDYQNIGQQNGVPDRAKSSQQANRQKAGADAVSSQKEPVEKKKKRGILAWIALAAGVVVVIAGILLLTIGKGKDSGNQNGTETMLNGHSLAPSAPIPEPDSDGVIPPLNGDSFVPDVVGQNKDTATTVLKDAKFTVDVTENYDETVPAGIVISQNPAADTEQTEGARITIVVSKGRQPVTVSFDANGGSASSSSVTVYVGGNYGTLPTVTRFGHSFTGWYTAKSGGSRVDAGTIVTNSNNHTLYAQWSTDTLTVSLNANGGSVSPTSKQTSYGGSYGTLPTPTRAGYSFTGWYTAKSGGTKIDGNSTVSNVSDHTLYAHWDEIIPSYLSYYSAPSSLGSDLHKPIVSIEGDLYQFPCPVRAFLKNGWTGNDLDDIADPAYLHGLTLTRNGKTISFGNVSNPMAERTTFRNCVVEGIIIDDDPDKNVDFNSSINIYLPNNITLGSSREYVMSVLPSDFETDTDYYERMFYRYTIYNSLGNYIGDIVITMDQTNSFVVGIGVTKFYN